MRNDKKVGRRLLKVGQSYVVQTIEECKRKCDKKDLCSGFSFFPERVSKNCYLKARMLKQIYLEGSSEKFTFAQKLPLLNSFNMTANCEIPRGVKETKVCIRKDQSGRKSEKNVKFINIIIIRRSEF